MKQIDRLLRWARKAHSCTGKRLLASVEYREDLQKFVVGGSVYDSKGTSYGGNALSEHDTLQDALGVIDALAAQYQSADKITIIIDDLTFPEGVMMPNED
ncbi:MAG: hypothetical protein IJ381_07200 [Clostridia bacterium]|nr:hypothetical protein [Clostridia bacterium]